MWKTTLYETTRLTLELRDIVNNGKNSVDIWNFDYPSYYKDVEKKAFEQKVIDHYYFRQIGSETVGRFLHQFRTKIREIMPYYIQLYKSVELMSNIEDPFGNVDITETFEQTSTGTTSTNNTTTSSSELESSGTSTSSSETTSEDNRTTSENKQHKYSNTPQGSIANIDKYMTEASTDVNSGTDNLNSSGSSEMNTTTTDSSSSSGTTSDSGDTTSNETIKHTYTKKGNQGVNTYAHDMKELRETFIDVDMMIINELNELFLGVY